MLWCEPPLGGIVRYCSILPYSAKLVRLVEVEDMGVSDSPGPSPHSGVVTATRKQCQQVMLMMTLVYCQVWLSQSPL